MNVLAIIESTSYSPPVKKNNDGPKIEVIDEDTESSINDIVERYNSIINKSFTSFFEQNTAFLIFKAALHATTVVNNKWIIESTGPFFFKYRNEITEKNVDFFLKHDYKDQMEDWLSITGKYGEYIAKEFVKNIKNSIQRSVDTNPDEIGEAVKELLSLYCKYVQYSR